MRDQNGETPLFLAARLGDPAIFTWFQGNQQYFKARGSQNYAGETLEHIVCALKHHKVAEIMKPKPELRDYSGNLPLFSSVASNDVEMIQAHFKRGRDYFSIRNYKYETLFHVAASKDSLEAL